MAVKCQSQLSWWLLGASASVGKQLRSIGVFLNRPRAASQPLRLHSLFIIPTLLLLFLLVSQEIQIEDEGLWPQEIDRSRMYVSV